MEWATAAYERYVLLHLCRRHAECLRNLAAFSLCDLFEMVVGRCKEGRIGSIALQLEAKAFSERADTVGDALGVPYEFRIRGMFECTGMVGHGSYDQPGGTRSDDTSMALATCDSIRAMGRIDVYDMRGTLFTGTARVRIP